MRNKEFLKLMQKRVAEAVIGSSTLRNQGTPGVIQTARNYLKKIDISTFITKDEVKFQKKLNSKTNILKNKFDKKAQNWGAARKVMNLFLRDSFYNWYLCTEYRLDKIEKWLEVPLDKDVANGLRKVREGKSLSRWESIKKLILRASKKYQKIAKEYGDGKGIARVHLDLLFWRPNKK